MLYKLIEDVDQSDLQMTDNVNTCTCLFFEKVSECLDRAIPKRVVKRSNRGSSTKLVFVTKEKR